MVGIELKICSENTYMFAKVSADPPTEGVEVRHTVAPALEATMLLETLVGWNRASSLILRRLGLELSVTLNFWMVGQECD